MGQKTYLLPHLIDSLQNRIYFIGGHIVQAGLSITVAELDKQQCLCHKTRASVVSAFCLVTHVFVANYLAFCT